MRKRPFGLHALPPRNKALPLLGRKRHAAAGGGGGSYTGPLDIVASPLVAYGNRALSSAYRGSALYTLRESGGGTTQSFNADATTGDAPQASIVSFIGAGSGFGRVWKDQSGNANDITQTTAGSQPGWEANVANSHPGLVFPANKVFDAANALAAKTALTVIIAFRMDDTSLGPLLFRLRNSNELITNSTFQMGSYYDQEGDFFAYTNGNFAEEYDLATDAWVFANGVKYIVSLKVLADGNMSGTLNGAALDLEVYAGVAAALEAITTIPQMTAANGGHTALEVILYGSAVSDVNIASIVQNMATYYGITLP